MCFVVWKTKSPPTSFDSSPSATLPSALSPMLPFLLEPPTIYNVPFECTPLRFDLCAASNEKNVHELMIWEYVPPINRLDQEQCNKDLWSIDQFINLSTPHVGDDLPTALRHCFRGWNIPFDGPSHQLLSIFWWKSPEDEARFKNPCEPNSLYETSGYYDDLYVEWFSSVVTRMQQKKRISIKKHVHIHLTVWGTSLNQTSSRPSECL